MTETKTFDTSTLKGLKDAERYKTRLENEYDEVTTVPVGFDRVRIVAEPHQLEIIARRARGLRP